MQYSVSRVGIQSHQGLQYMAAVVVVVKTTTITTTGNRSSSAYRMFNNRLVSSVCLSVFLSVCAVLVCFSLSSNHCFGLFLSGSARLVVSLTCSPLPPSYSYSQVFPLSLWLEQQ